VLFEKADDQGDKVVVSGVAYAALGPAHPDLQGDFSDKNGVFSMHESFSATAKKLSYMHEYELTDEQARATKSELSPR